MVTYASARTATLGVSSLIPAGVLAGAHGRGVEAGFVPAACPRTGPVQGSGLPTGSGMPMTNEANAWLSRAAVAAVVRLLPATALPITTATKQRDAFAGVSPGLRSTSPPV